MELTREAGGIALSPVRLFAIFAAAFWLLAIQRIAIVVSERWLEDATPFYVLRLVAFLLILFAIIDKNRQGRR